MRNNAHRILIRSIIVFAGIAVLFISTQTSQAQNLLNNPESVVYDSLYDRYLVSNFGDGSIVQIDADGNQSYFSTALPRIAGLHIHGEILYVASNLTPYTGVYGFDLATAEMVFGVDIPGSQLMNDVATDTSGYLYVTDYYDHKLYKIDLQEQTYSLFVETTLYWPNGIVFDAPNNRILVASVEAQGRPIHAVNLEDSTVTVAVYTYLPAMDGLAFDSQGRLYISSWYTDAIHRYDRALTNPPEVFSSGHPDPADISVDFTHSIVCIPIFYENRVDFVEINPVSIDGNETPERPFVSKSYPNPFNSTTIIMYNSPVSSDVVIEVYDVLGRRIDTLFEGFLPAGDHQTVWNAAEVSSGVYFYGIRTGRYQESGSMTLLK
jgi:sugar lactone lactonase YvrE